MMKKPSATWHRRLAAPQRALQPAPPHLLRRRPMASAAAADGAAGAGPAVAPLTHQDNEYIQTPLKQGTYGFHLGQPGPDLIPLQRIKQALGEVVTSEADPLMMQYRQPVDFLSVRQSLADMLSEQHGIAVSPDHLAITPGNSAALGMIFSNVRLRRARAPGDNRPCVAVVENPTYFLAGAMFSDVGIETRSVSIDEDGMRVDELAAMCEAGEAPEFVYTIPNYHNPTGAVLSAARREQLLKLADEHDFLVIADEPYNLLVYGGQPAPLPLVASGSERVICLGSFAKLLAPGIRLGWMHTCPALVQKAWRSVGVLDSGGGLNPLGSLIVNQLLKDGFLLENIAKLRSVFEQRIDAMCAALDAHLPGCTYTRPAGGYFMWVELPPTFPGDAESLLESSSAEEAEVPVFFTLGNKCIADPLPEARQFGRRFRMSFAFHTAEEIGNGIAELGRVVARLTEK